MFESPLHFCPVQKTWVALDQSVEQCRAASGCAGLCPLCRYFMVLSDAMRRDRVAADRMASLSAKPLP